MTYKDSIVLKLLGAGLLASMLWVPLAIAGPGKPAKSPSDKPGKVWVVVFSSPECPHCEKAMGLIDRLKRKYPIRTKVFDIDNDHDYKIYKRLEAIRARDEFAVPLVMVGESMLMGDKEISRKLEKIVKKLARSGGSRLPYLGSAKSQDDSVDRTGDSDCDHCGRQGRPPTIGEEWRKVKGFVDKFF
jgi:glutaredoxin